MFPITTRFLKLLAIIPTWILLFILIKPIQLAPSFYEKVKAKLKKKPLLAYFKDLKRFFRKEEPAQNFLFLLDQLIRHYELEEQRLGNNHSYPYLQSYAFRRHFVSGLYPDTDETEDQPRINTDFDFLYVTDHNHNVVGRR